MKKEEELTKDQAWKILTTRYGATGIGFAVGGMTGMVMKRGFWGIVGFAVLGSVLGSGIGLLASRNALEQSKQTEEDKK